MKKLIACLSAIFLAFALTVTFTPANAATNPNDGLTYNGVFDGTTPGGYQGGDSDRMNGQVFTTNVAGTITGATFYKGSGQNSAYGFKSSLYKIWADGTTVERVRDMSYSGSLINSNVSGWQNAWFSTPYSVSAGEKFIIATNAPTGYFAMDLNYFANGNTYTQNGMTVSKGKYVYTNTSGTQYAYPSNDTNTKYSMSALFKPNSPSTTYPAHTNIVATTFWVGEVFNSQLSDGSQVCSTYDGQWASRWSSNEPSIGTSPTGTDCGPNGTYTGALVGGCDGVPAGTTVATFTCDTQARTSSNNYLPTGTNAQTPAENHFYLDLPYDDVNDTVAFAERCGVIPWAAATNAALGSNKCADSNFSYMKNRWVKMTRGSNVCYGQIQDAGPSTGTNYHDKAYVFGSTDARPLNQEYSGDPTQGAGADVSPALVGCLGFTNLNGDTDHMDWQFVERADVPSGPWTIYETTSQVNW